jgi:hypothetical protein
MKNFETCYEWQVENFKGVGWAANLRDKLRKSWLGYILQDRQKGGGRATDQIIKTRCSDMQRQMSIEKMGEEIFSCIVVFEEREGEGIIYAIYNIYYIYIYIGVIGMMGMG